MTLPRTQIRESTFNMPLAGGTLQRKCACGQHTVAGGGCAECAGKGLLQRRASSDVTASEVPPIVHDVLRSPGQPLDTATRAFMEPRLGHDFSQVRVHADMKAAESAQAVNALAYTVGPRIVFEAGRYAPGTSAGNRLLAHELTHVMQQSRSIGGSASPLPLAIGQPGDQFEKEADHAAQVVVGNARNAHLGFAAVPSASHVLRRQPESTPEQILEIQLRQLATRPRQGLKQWRQLSQSDRDQVLRNMILLYGPSFSSEFLKYTKGEKKPRLNEGGVLKGFEFTPKWLFDRGYRRAYGDLWVHPSGEEITLLESRRETAEPDLAEPPEDMGKKCPETCFSDSQDKEECETCCEQTFPDVDSECRKYCDSRCNDKL